MAGACVMQKCSNLAGTNVGRVPTGFSKIFSRVEIKFGLCSSWRSSCRNANLRGISIPFTAEIFKDGIHSTKAVSLDEQTGQTDGFDLAEEPSRRYYSWKDFKRPRVCILGGGFGGLYTALRLESLTWEPDKRPQVLLIDQSDRFVFKPLLYEILSREVDKWEIAPKFSELLFNTDIEFVQDSVVAVSPLDGLHGSSAFKPGVTSCGGVVFLRGGLQVEYDWLVMALGAESKLDLVPGALEFALPFVSLDDALEVDRQLILLERDRFGLESSPIEVVVIGSGYSGIELAATVAERLGKQGRIKVVDPHADICASSAVFNQQEALKVLISRNVQLELGFYASNIRNSTSQDNGAVLAHGAVTKLIVDLQPATQRQSRMTGGRQVKADIVIWTVGTKATVPSGPDANSVPFPLNGRGQADTDETLRVMGHPQMFALGDSAGAKDSSGRSLPATAQVAFQQSDYAAWNLWAAINNQPLLPFRYQHLGEMMTLGTNHGAVSAGSLTLGGPLGHAARKLAYLYRLPANPHKAKVALSWLAKSTISSVAFIQNELLKAMSFR